MSAIDFLIDLAGTISGWIFLFLMAVAAARAAAGKSHTHIIIVSRSPRPRGSEQIPRMPRAARFGRLLLAMTLASALSASDRAGAQEAEPAKPLGNLTVRKTSSGGKTKTNWQTRCGSSEKDKTEHIYLEVSVRNVGQIRTEFTTVTSFLVVPSGDVKDMKNHRTYETVKQTCELSPFEMKKETIDSGVDSSRLNVARCDREFRSGYQFSGWVTWLLAGDEVLSVAASDRQIEQVALKEGLSAFPSIEKERPGFRRE